MWPFLLVLLYSSSILCCGPVGRSNDFCVVATLKGLDPLWVPDLVNNPQSPIYKLIKSNFDSHMGAIATTTNYRNRDVRGTLCKFEYWSPSEIKVFVKLSAKAEQADVEKIIAGTLFEPFAFSSAPQITTITSCSGC